MMMSVASKLEKCMNVALPPMGSQIRRSFDSVARLTETRLLSGAGATLNYHGYSYNAGNQRTAQVRTDNSYVTYGYDNNGQLQAATGRVLGGALRMHEQFGYGYVGAGNLHFRTNNALVQTFTPDALNQLSTITRSGTFTVAGTIVGPATSLSVNGQAAATYTDNTFAVTNVTLNPGVNSFTAIAHDAYNRGDTNTVTVNLPVTATYQYDSNGNLTSDGQRIFDYDDENQLIRVTVANAWMTEFTYDGLGRRRIRRDKSWSTALGDWQIANEVRYVYDGNLVLQERDANNLPTVTYTRGADLSGGFQGAGGIGGLLARTSNPQLVTGDPTSAHAYYHADGNGNITTLIDSRQQIAARYLYDPYGNTLSIIGPLADANTLRFSSKECHEDSGLYYYGFRFYDPYLQRWLNQDPKGERGGINLYGFAENQPVDTVDALGLDKVYLTSNGFLVIYPSWWKCWRWGQGPVTFAGTAELYEKELEKRKLEDAAAAIGASVALSQIAEGSANEETRKAATRGSGLHADKPGNLPDQLREKFPDTQFEFKKPGEAGPDVKVIGGKHPSEYPSSTWPGNVEHGDFKPATEGGEKTFKHDQKVKWSDRVQMLPYNPKTKKLE